MKERSNGIIERNIIKAVKDRCTNKFDIQKLCKPVTEI